MSAQYKRIYSKPSLSDIWFFEKYVSLFVLDDNDFLTPEKEFSGYISSTVLETITLDELESRKDELNSIRPDLYNLLFEMIEEDYTDLSSGTVAELMKKHNVTPKINPFDIVRTEIIEFDTWENLINAYETIISRDGSLVPSIKNDLTQFNNTLVEEFYISDVKQDYVGKLSS